VALNFPLRDSHVLYVDDGDNVRRNNQPYFQPYIIKDKTFVDSDGKKPTVKIGYIGFVRHKSMDVG